MSHSNNSQLDKLLKGILSFITILKIRVLQQHAMTQLYTNLVNLAYIILLICALC